MDPDEQSTRFDHLDWYLGKTAGYHASVGAEAEREWAALAGPSTDITRAVGYDHARDQFARRVSNALCTCEATPDGGEHHYTCPSSSVIAMLHDAEADDYLRATEPLGEQSADMKGK